MGGPEFGDVLRAAEREAMEWGAPLVRIVVPTSADEVSIPGWSMQYQTESYRLTLVTAPAPKSSAPSTYEFTRLESNRVDQARLAEIGDLVEESIGFTRTDARYKCAAQYAQELECYLSSGSLCWIATRAKALCGFGMCTRDEDDLGDNLGLGFYVDRSHLRRDIGTTLVSRVLNEGLVKDLGFAQITTWTDGGGVGLYRSVGFQFRERFSILQRQP
jgi:GNAT superfamily N-acetyltransferase